jgi:putative ABC transport system permease protein
LVTSQLPLSGDADAYGVRFEHDDDPSGAHAAYRYVVSPGWIETMGLRVLRGRPLGERDTPEAPASALISESFARRTFRSRDPIGQRLRLGGDEQAWLTIVGVVPDVKQSSLAAGVEDAVFLTTGHFYFTDRVRWLAVRVRGDAPGMIPAIRRAVWSVDADQPIVRATTMADLLSASEARRRFALRVFEMFAVLALTLAAIGIYGVLSGSVGERMREIGVRSALGASRRSILSLVLRQGLTMAGIGVVFGLAGALAASRALTTLLFDVSRIDPLTYTGVIITLGVVAAAACWLPAWRASRVDPATTLRAQ